MSVADSNNYLRNRVMQASREQLQLMLYDGAIRFALEGREAILKKDYERSYEKLSRAQSILLEMQASLRPEVNAALCEQMSSLYDFVYRKLVSGSVTREVVEVDDAVKILRHQRQTWAMLMEKVTEARAESEHGDSREAEVFERGSLFVEG